MADRLRKALAERDAAVRRRGKGNITSKGFFNALEQAANFAIPFTPDNIRWMREQGERIRSGNASAEDYMSAVAIGAVPIGGKYAPRTPGLKAEIAEAGDEWVGYDAIPQTLRPWNVDTRHFNLRNEADEIVASFNRAKPSRPGARSAFGAERGAKPEVYVPEMWVREDYRQTPALFDLYRLASHGGRYKTRANFANARLAVVHARNELRMAKENLKALRDAGLPPDSDKVLKAAGDVGTAESELAIARQASPRRNPRQRRREQGAIAQTPPWRSRMSDYDRADRGEGEWGSDAALRIDADDDLPNLVGDLDIELRSPEQMEQISADRARQARERQWARMLEERARLRAHTAPPPRQNATLARQLRASDAMNRQQARTRWPATHAPLATRGQRNERDVRRARQMASPARTVYPMVTGDMLRRGGQLTNRDVPSVRQMAPVRRVPPPRPAVDPITARAQEAAAQIALRHAMQAARTSAIQQSVAALRRRSGR